MPNLTSVTLTAGVPTAGTGTVSTIDALMALQNANGQAVMASSAPVVIASNQTSIPVAATLAAETTKVIGTVNVAASQTVGLAAGSAVIGHVIVDTAPTTAVTNAIGDPALSKFATGKYVTVAASQTATVLQASAGATGDYISGVLVIPATTSPGNVILLDNATSITIFTGGATSVSNLVPFFIPLGAVSASGAWKLTTGANVSCIGIGKFS